ncbi:MAG: Bax inhibitor-1/YccA family protein [Alphaproteobacteria bacterium]|nr:Bax inhibitor-1/YccA family protein [Alphaproteobacteria bacterium]
MAPQFEHKVAYGQTQAAEIDLGLRAHMLRVYNYMVAALALSGGAALIGSQPAFAHAILGTPLAWVVMFAPLVLVFFLSARVHAMSFAAAQATFWVYAVLSGLSLSYVFLVYATGDIARMFFVTAGTFAGVSLWGYTTSRDLTGFGSFLFMGLIGVIIASVVNIFIGSSMMNFVVSALGVLIFTGLTAYDTQKIKEMYIAGDATETAGKKAIMSALVLYLDFINLFIMLLRLFGNSRN